MEPTIDQLKGFLRLSIRTSNLLQNIELVRFDEITNRIVVLIGETIQVEILSKWRGDYRMSDYLNLSRKRTAGIRQSQPPG